MFSILSAAALSAASLLAIAPHASADGTCYGVRSSATYVYAYCSGSLDTGLVRVTARLCNGQGCYNTSGPWVYKASGKRSELRVTNASLTLTGAGYETRAN
jgi:hypothetical protein